MPRVVREYHIDLRRPADKRWSQMIRAERTRARDLIANCLGEAKVLAERSTAGKWAYRFARKLTPLIYDLAGHGYSEDIDAWSEGTGIPRKDLIFANLSYELSQVAGARTKNPLRFNPMGCTAAAYDLPDGGVAHVRNMDWRLTGVGTFTVVIHYTGPCGTFTTVGWPSYIGVLSGVAKGRFSATINQAPQIGSVRPNWPPSFALRRAFESCRTFEEAVEQLCGTKLAASAFFTLAGPEAGQAVVIEHLGSKAACRGMRAGRLAAANHYVSAELEGRNHDKLMSLDDSRLRLQCASAALEQPAPTRLPQMVRVLGAGPTLHQFTAQRMAFVARTGAYDVRYEDTDTAVAKWFEDLKEGNS